MQISSRPSRFGDRFEQFIWCMILVAGALVAAPAHAQHHEPGMHHMHGSDGAPVARSGNTGELPALKILLPQSGNTIGERVAFVFQADDNIAEMTMSSANPSVHLHVAMDETELMPMADQLIQLGDGRYLYVFDLPAKPGRHTIRLYWADPQHHTISETVQTLNVVVKESK